MPDPDLFSTVFQQNFFTNLAFSMLEAAWFTRKLVPNFYFLTCVLHFMLDSGPNPVPEPKCIMVPVPLRQKIAVPAVPVP